MTTRPLVLLALLLAVGCSNSSKQATPTSPSPSTSTPVIATTAAPSTQPTTSTAVPTTVATTVAVTTTVTPASTSAPEPIESQLQRLLDRYDAAVQAILVDPRVAGDPVNPAVVAYLALFPPNSDFAAGAIEAWVKDGAKGRFYRPGASGSILKSKLHKITASSVTEVTFLVCTLQSAEIIDETGKVLEATGGLIGGEIVVTRVNDAWLLRELTQRPAGDCPKPGSTG
jgi:hypothetical protein